MADSVQKQLQRLRSYRSALDNLDSLIRNSKETNRKYKVRLSELKAIKDVFDGLRSIDVFSMEYVFDKQPNAVRLQIHAARASVEDRIHVLEGRSKKRGDEQSVPSPPAVPARTIRQENAEDTVSLNRHDACTAERTKLRDDYKAECKRAGVRVTDEMIAKAANPRWKSRSNIQKWRSCDSKYEGSADRKIREVFRKKPHLPERSVAGPNF